MMAECKTCVNGYPHAECVNCGTGFRNYRPYKPMTNADRIRAMSDEELAIMFAMLRADLSRLDALVRTYSGKDVNDNYDWLQRPAKEDA